MHLSGQKKLATFGEGRGVDILSFSRTGPKMISKRETYRQQVRCSHKEVAMEGFGFVTSADRTNAEFAVAYLNCCLKPFPNDVINEEFADSFNVMTQQDQEKVLFNC